MDRSRLRDTDAKAADRETSAARLAGAPGQAVPAFGEHRETARPSSRDRHESVITATTVTESLHAAGQYLRERGPTGIVEDAEAIIRRYPIQTMLLGLGIGYLFSQLRGGRHG